ncbi:hypothetical protein SAY86_021606 [Trapa natans]|uniref:Uncharacterized protein n=1 Tax=Trapa natans TaxID=22666 RepID=A0AAN7MA25_TRANT|nr:hypothetical protein SAY86_021606 [Trapa natans]
MKTVDAVLEQCHDNGFASYHCHFQAQTLCGLVKSRVECPDFIEKIENAQVPVPQNYAEEGSSWDLVNDSDIWEGENLDVDKEDYVLARQEDIVEGIACFMAAYLAALKERKELTPNQLQEALSKTFSAKKKKGMLRKAWDGTEVIYNVASWGATAIGIYQNPVLLGAASKAFWTSCYVISKLFMKSLLLVVPTWALCKRCHSIDTM